MFKHIGFMLFITTFLEFDGLGQPWSYNFGTEVWSITTAGTNTTFPPAPQTGGGSRYIRIGAAAGSFNSQATISGFSTGSCLRGVASSSGSVNKFAIYDYTPGKFATLNFRVRFGNSSGNSEPASGIWFFFLGDGTTFSSTASFDGTQTFVGLRFTFGASGAITTNTRTGSNWVTTGITGTPFAQGNNYLVDIVANNSAVTMDYGTGTVAANKYDLWVNGVLVGNELAKAGIGNNANMDSFMFYGESSTGNVANIFLDDFVYSNTATSILPVELTSFTASAKGSTVTLNWETKTEVDNNGFEVERNVSGNWDKIGFVEGHGTANSPKYYSFVDNGAIGNKIQYRLKQIDNDGTFEYSPEVEVELNPTTFALYQNYPNPFNPSTIIRFSMPVNGNVVLNVFNTLGEKVASLLNGQMEAGYHEVSFDAKNLPSGLYFYEIKAGDFSSIKKMILIK